MDMEERGGELAHADLTGFLSFITVVWKLLLAASILQVTSQICDLCTCYRCLLWATGVLTMLSFFLTLFIYGYWYPLVELEKIP